MYLGRLVGVGRLGPFDKAFAVYAVSGRSEGSKKRKAFYKKNGIRIDSSERKDIPFLLKPFDLMTGGIFSLPREQWKNRKLILYDAMKGKNKHCLLAVSNGRQTGPTYRYLKLLYPELEKDSHLGIQEGFVDLEGAEPDRYRTPRITGIISGTKAFLGIVTGSGSIAKKVRLEEKTQYVSTYSGDPSDNKKIVIPDLTIPTGEIDLTGKNAQDLADNLYDWMDQYLVVSTAAALWNPSISEWEFAVRNLHE